ncbi:MAG TPA: phosphoribosylamine--glycine ligase [Candidatus Acidoferrum sp.]|nr:phosphoribosylamine--glycine ligase [Candidatus Acidoferrum sp.]
MKILVVGGGGREHALVWKLKQSAGIEKIWCAPGNGGIAEDAECLAVDAGDVAALVSLAEKIAPDLTVVGPELPLVNGISDAFTQRNWAIVGPSRQAAQLEGSKIFSKEFLLRHNIPTARMYGSSDSASDAYAALSGVDWPLVIKADGLCAGKGVVLAPDAEVAKQFLVSVMEKNELGPGGQRVLLEETLEGEELSFIILTDGERYAPMVPTRDHKRVFDGNRGPNTGGMGAYSSDELLPAGLRNTVISKIVEPTLRGLAADGIPYQGFLYVGLMLTKTGPKVLEFNCRLGDPEAQAIVARMDFDLAEVLQDVAARRLDPAKLRWKSGASVCVVLTSGGYPGKFETGKRIEGLTSIDRETGVEVFQAGTKRERDSVITSGGRVLGVTAAADSLETSLALAYEATEKIHFDGMHYRKDIGARVGRVKTAGD